jgi:hypothetical protein
VAEALGEVAFEVLTAADGAAVLDLAAREPVISSLLTSPSRRRMHALYCGASAGVGGST